MSWVSRAGPHALWSAVRGGSGELIMGGSHFTIESERDRTSNICLSLGSEAGCVQARCHCQRWKTPFISRMDDVAGSATSCKSLPPWVRGTSYFPVSFPIPGTRPIDSGSGSAAVRYTVNAACFLLDRWCERPLSNVFFPFSFTVLSSWQQECGLWINTCMGLCCT